MPYRIVHPVLFGREVILRTESFGIINISFLAKASPANPSSQDRGDQDRGLSAAQENSNSRRKQTRCHAVSALAREATEMQNGAGPDGDRVNPNLNELALHRHWTVHRD
jgi:hypothetical protein